VVPVQSCKLMWSPLYQTREHIWLYVESVLTVFSMQRWTYGLVYYKDGQLS